VCPFCAEKSREDKEGAGAAGSPHAWTSHDFRAVLPLWKKYTDAVRQNDKARSAAGWMAEM